MGASFTMQNNNTALNAINADTVCDKVYERIKAMILNGEYPPGSRLVQENITAQFQVSRTPVREALQRLSTEGLVIIKPYYGAEVFNLSLDELHEIYDIRICIERYAAEKSCPTLDRKDIEELECINQNARDNINNLSISLQSDRDFHRTICTKAISETTISILEGLWNKCDPYRSLYLTSKDNVLHTINEHDNIISSLKKSDYNAVGQLIQAHLQDVVEKISNIQRKI